MGLASVVGGECSGWAAEECVEEHADGQREQALGDSLDQAGDRLGEVLFEAHLAFEVGEQGFDHEPDAGFGDLPPFPRSVVSPNVATCEAVSDAQGVPSSTYEGETSGSPTSPTCQWRAWLYSAPGTIRLHPVKPTDLS